MEEVTKKNISEEEILENKKLEDQFDQLAAKWKKDMEFFSLAHLVYSHEDYLKIIEMGKKFLPFILKDLEKLGIIGSLLY